MLRMLARVWGFVSSDTTLLEARLPVEGEELKQLHSERWDAAYRGITVRHTYV